MINTNEIPHLPGVYLMRDGGGKIIYIGKAKDLRKRVSQYFTGKKTDWKTASLVMVVRKIDYIVCASERDAFVLEDKLIKGNQPFFNVMLKDGKTYPYVQITADPYPRIITTRKRKKDGSKYYGPYPNGLQLRNLLKFLWRSKIINARPCKWKFSEDKPLAAHKINSCVYFHTGQCIAPCNGPQAAHDYKALIKRAVLFFEGKYTQVISKLEILMKQQADSLNYEAALEYRDIINTLQNMRQRITVSKIQEDQLEFGKPEALKRLAQALGLKSLPQHIEAFDTSGLFGKQAVGSMVCFKGGAPCKDHYRRFKIKSDLPEYGNNDFVMIAEIVERRVKALKRAKEPLPDLFVIDGGKGQISAVQSALFRQKINIPIIGLAKREEEIFFPFKEDSLKLDKNDQALLLLMQMRDEVHRFGITYHRYLRNKKLMEED